MRAKVQNSSVAKENGEKVNFTFNLLRITLLHLTRYFFL